MISGLNTQVQFEDDHFHIQTEDCGRTNPVIDTTIYLGGAIIGSKKTSYKEFLESAAFNEKDLQQMLERQYYSLVRAIHSGRVSARRREHDQAQSGPEAAAPHVELMTGVLSGTTTENPHEMRIRLVETTKGASMANIEVAVEIFGGSMPTQRLKGTTDAEGFLNLKIEIPESHRVAAAMLFRVDRPEPSQELKVLIVKSSSKAARK